MPDLREVIAYLIKHYPHKQQLSKARLTKMVYLADWRAAIKLNRQITGITWEFHHYGPYVQDVAELANTDPLFEKHESKNIFGQWKEVMSLTNMAYEPTLGETDRKVLDHVIDRTKDKTWDEFIRLVYSTYPIRTQPRFSQLNLLVLARKYARECGLSNVSSLPVA